MWNLGNKSRKLSAAILASFPAGASATNPIGLRAGPLRPVSDSTTAIQVQQADGTGFVFFDTANKRIGINCTPVVDFQTATSSTSSPRGAMSSQHSDGTDGARFHGGKSRGTNASPTVIVTGDNLLKLVASGYDGSAYQEMGAISIQSTGTIGAGRVPTKIIFSTATDASPSVLTDRMVIDTNGKTSITGECTNGGTLLAITDNSTVTYHGAFDFLAPNMSNSQHYGFSVGKNAQNYNRAEFDYFHVGDGNTSNSFAISFHGVTVAPLTINAAGVTTIGAGGSLKIGTQQVLSLDGTHVQVGTTTDGGTQFASAVYVEAAGGALTAAKCMNTLINNYGQTDDITYALPAAAKGLAFDFIAGTGVAKYVRFDPNGTEVIYLNGTALAGGAYIGIASIVAGMQVRFRTFQTGASSYAWRATTLDAFASE